jgi:3-oxoacyl-[acyl-carrier protein] reductase
MSKLKDKVALVTGAGRGIGRGIALALASAGADVVLTARSGDELLAVAREISAAGGKAEAMAADVSLETDVEQLFGKLRQQRGRVDILINNAGIGAFGLLAEISAADFDRVLAVNLRGTFLCSREAMRLMKEQQSGYIINISSSVGIKGYPNQSAYTASKHGIMGLTKSLAVEAQEDGIRVSAVLPGAVNTDLIGAARPDLDRAKLLQPEDVAQAVLYLLSLPERAAIDEIYIRRRGSQPW